MTRKQASLMHWFCGSFGASPLPKPHQALLRPDQYGCLRFFVPNPAIPMRCREDEYPRDQVPTQSENVVAWLRELETCGLLTVYDHRQPGLVGGLDDDAVTPYDPEAPIEVILENPALQYYNAALWLAHTR